MIVRKGNKESIGPRDRIWGLGFKGSAGSHEEYIFAGGARL